MKIRDLFDLIKTTFSEWSEDKASRMAASLSYYAIFSMAPLLAVAIAIAGLVYRQQAITRQISTHLSGLIGPNAAELIQNIVLATQSKNTGIFVTVIGFATLLFGATGLFGQMQEALNTIWGVAPKPGLGITSTIKERLLSFGMVIGVGLLLMLLMALSTVISAIESFAVDLLPGFVMTAHIINFIASFAIITILFALVFKILPDAETAWKDIWLGSAVTALLFTIGKLLIGFYLGYSSIRSTYAAAGSLPVILLWVYYSAQIFFLGAEFIQVYADKFGSGIVPSHNAVLLVEVMRSRQEVLEKMRGEALDLEISAPESKALEVATVSPEPPEPAQPSLVVFSTVLATLVGFIGGLIIRRGSNPGS